MGLGWRDLVRAVIDLAERPRSDVEVDADITMDGEHFHWHSTGHQKGHDDSESHETGNGSR